MDLFNRKALADERARLSLSDALLAEMQARLSGLEELSTTREKFILELSATGKELLYENKQLVAEKQALEVKNAVLMERLDLLTSGVLDTPAAPQTWGEDVEDAEYLFRTGRIDRGEFEAALESAGFANTEIEFDSGSLPRI